MLSQIIREFLTRSSRFVAQPTIVGILTSDDVV